MPNDRAMVSQLIIEEPCMSIDMGDVNGGADVRDNRTGDEEGARPLVCNSGLDSVFIHPQKASKERGRVACPEGLSDVAIGVQ